MKFREWLRLDEVKYGGLWRRFQQQYPNVPEYVLKQMYINHISPEMHHNLNAGRKSMNGSSTVQHAPQASGGAATAAYTPAGSETPSSPSVPSSLPSDVINRNDILTGVIWGKKPEVVAVSPMSFDRRTIKIFVDWGFGHNPRTNGAGKVRDDVGRTNTQRALATQRQEGQNEPIIMIDLGGGMYQLIEGFHRTASYLLQGAPPDQLQLLQSGQTKGLNLGLWQPVSINAYVGRKSDVRQPNPYVTAQQQQQGVVGGQAA